jgi:hypothetical protein
MTVAVIYVLSLELFFAIGFFCHFPIIVASSQSDYNLHLDRLSAFNLNHKQTNIQRCPFVYLLSKCEIVQNSTSTTIMCIETSHHQTPITLLQKDKVCIIGSGNWGSAIARIIGANTQRLSTHFETDVNMWVFEEMIDVGDGKQEKLTDIINTRHENVKYLPGVQLPENVKAVADLHDACLGATLLVFILPHQFLPRLIPTIKAAVASSPSVRGVSLIKGLGK